MQNDKNNTAVNFLKVMIEGKVVLEYLREYLTNTHIKTEFYLRTSENNIISTDSNNLSYSYCLSTYGGSGKNYVSLAYSLDQSIGQAITDLRKSGLSTEIVNKKRNSESEKDEIFKIKALEKIENVKKFLVKEKKEYAYVKNFDSKDAEIVQKLIATPSLIPRLGQPQAEYGREFTTLYQYYRSKMGGGGGIKTTALQSGDIGDTQVKLFSNNRVVNVMRQTMIRKTFKDLQENLQITDINKFKEFLYKEFTSRSKKTDAKMDQAFQKESRKGIDEILKHLDVTNFKTKT